MAFAMPMPPAPFVAPDMRIIQSSPSSQLLVVTDLRGRSVYSGMVSNLWLAAERAPVEVEFRRIAGGRVRAYQVFYRDGTLSTEESATLRQQVEPYALRASDGSSMGVLRRFVRVVIRRRDGTPVVWRDVGMCNAGMLARLDRPGAPAEPSYMVSGCPSALPLATGTASIVIAGSTKLGAPHGVMLLQRAGSAHTTLFGGGIPIGAAFGMQPFVTGRTFGVDAGWASFANVDLGRGVAKLPSGTYRMTMTLNPRLHLADADPSDNSATSTLKVYHLSLDAKGRALPDSMTGRNPLSAIAIPPPAGATRMAQPRMVAVGTATPNQLAAHLRGAVADAPMIDMVTPSAGARAIPRSAPEGVDLPDLRSAPAFAIAAAPAGRADTLGFASLTYNVGPGRLEVEAFREAGATFTAYQVFLRDGKRIDRQRRGVVVWHGAHEHFHFQSFARYDLVDDRGRVVRTSGKNSWCIADTTYVDDTIPGFVPPTAPWDATPLNDCGSQPGALWIRLSMSVGAGDIYAQGLPGQAFNISGLPNGHYSIRITANPDDIIAESDYGNNVANRSIWLLGRRGHRSALVPPHPMVTELPPGLTQYPFEDDE